MPGLDIEPKPIRKSPLAEVMPLILPEVQLTGDPTKHELWPDRSGLGEVADLQNTPTQPGPLNAVDEADSAGFEASVQKELHHA